MLSRDHDSLLVDGGRNPQSSLLSVTIVPMPDW